MGKLKYEQFDVEKSAVEKEYVGSGIDSESLSRDFERRQNNGSSSSRSWGQLILITLLTFLLWMVIFTFIGFLPIQSYNGYFQSPCGQQEQAAISKNPSQPGAGEEIPAGDLAVGVGIIEFKENEVDATIVVGTFGTVEQLPQLPQEEPVANFSVITNQDNAIEPLDPLVENYPPVLILPSPSTAMDDALRFPELDLEKLPVVEEFPMFSPPEIDAVPEQALFSMPVYEDNVEDEDERVMEGIESILMGQAQEAPAVVDPAIPTTEYFYLLSNPDEKLSWSQALDFCKPYGMQLVTIDSEQKQQKVSSFLAQEKVTLADMIWTSGRSMSGDESGPYVWATTGFTVNYTNWGADHNEVNENQVGGCIAMNLVDPALPDYFAWTKSDCEARHRFMCEI